MPWLFLTVALVGAWLTYNTYRPVFTRPRLSVVSFFAGWLTGELALHHILWQAAATALFIWAGALHSWPGVLGLCISVCSWVFLARWCWRIRVVEDVVEQALCLGLGRDYRDRIAPRIADQFAPGVDWPQILLPFPIRHAEVERLRDLPYAAVDGVTLALDVYRHHSHPTGCPTLLQIHGGAWVIGSKNEQALPLMQHLAARGWVCVAANYRLSPRATFPDHLIDVKRAVAWIREHATAYGADPDFVVITGGSAGAHLAALAALTPGDAEYQPGFESADTRVQACVAFYGVYDFADRRRLNPHRGLAHLLERQVMKASVAQAPAAYERASPISRITAAAPPFFIVHGTHDTLVPIAGARLFADGLRAASKNPVVFAEIPGAQHAFELFPSLRSGFVIHGVERFLAYAYSEHLRVQAAERAGIATAAEAAR